jgi:hypothetical protein
VPPSPAAYKQHTTNNGIAGGLGNIGTSPVIVGGSTMGAQHLRIQYPGVLSVNTNIIQAMRMAGASTDQPLSPRARP